MVLGYLVLGGSSFGPFCPLVLCSYSLFVSNLTSVLSCCLFLREISFLSCWRRQGPGDFLSHCAPPLSPPGGREVHWPLSLLLQTLPAPWGSVPFLLSRSPGGQAAPAPGPHTRCSEVTWVCLGLWWPQVSAFSLTDYCHEVWGLLWFSFRENCACAVNQLPLGSSLTCLPCHCVHLPLSGEPWLKVCVCVLWTDHLRKAFNEKS